MHLFIYYLAFTISWLTSDLLTLPQLLSPLDLRSNKHFTVELMPTRAILCTCSDHSSSDPFMHIKNNKRVKRPIIIKFLAVLEDEKTINCITREHYLVIFISESKPVSLGCVADTLFRSVTTF